MKLSSNKGFTLTELIVVMSIISVISALSLVSLRSGGRESDTRREAQILSLNLRRAQNMALAGTLYQGVAPDGYGIYLDTALPNSYILFADLDGNKIYSGSGELMETINLKQNIAVNSLAPAASLNVVYSPPEPTTTFYDNAGANLGGTASITLGYSGTTITKTVNLNASGQISAQ